MPLDSGVRLGSFEILGPLGSGGMGEVYRARDLRLGRDVALKLLPEAFARDPDRAARFQREARLLAAVNHPAIAAIYGAEESGAREFIVMELVPGETLADKLGPGALPIDESLRIARQIAEALEAAHERGVVHRDLKPSNIKVTPEGKVKVLDLGLAKAMEPSSPDAAISNSPTLVADRTRPGTILGTAEYMSPEQARGKEVDKRGDIWAFGCILFEMLSGRRAFTGETTSDALVAILSSEPDWSALPRETPERIRELLERCLQKDAGQRLRDAGDARLEIESCLAEEPSRSGARESVSRSRAMRRWAAPFLVLVLAAGGAAWLYLRGLRSGTAGGTADRMRSLVVLPSRDLSGAPGGQLVGDGLVETLSARLGELPGIQVVTPTAAVAASDRLVDPFRAAKSVGADLAVRSSLMRSGEVVRIAYSIWDVGNRAQVASGTVDGAASDLFGIQDRFAASVADGLKLKRSGARTPTPTGLETAGAQEKYLQALGNLNRYDKQPSIDRAISILEKLVVENPSSALVHAALGRAYLARHNLTREKTWAEKAIAASEQARRLAPSSPEANVSVGEVALRTGKPTEAVEAFRRALAAQPQNFDGLLGLARAYDLAGATQDAEASFRRATTLQPSYWFGYSKLAGFFFAHGRYREAAEMFAKVTQLQPDNARAFSNLGAAYHQMDRFEDALTAYRQSLALDPTAGAYSNAGTTEFFMGRYHDASRDFQKAVALAPDQYEAWVNLADAHYWTEGERGQALEAYRRAIGLLRRDLDLNPRNGLARARLAVCLARSDQGNAAARELQRALEQASQDPQVLYNAAIVAELAGTRAEAIRWIRDAVKAGCGVMQIRREPQFAGLVNDKSFQEALGSGATQKS